MINQLTFTRFLAAMMVVIYHYGRTTSTFNGETMTAILKYGNSAVSYFFILSGFVMIIAYGKRTTKLDKIAYYVNRIARIYPVYILALLAVALIAFQSSDGLSFKALILQGLVIQSWFPAYVMGLNPPGWSLSVEAFFYFLFPFLLSLYHRVNMQMVSFGIVLFWLFTQLLFNYLLVSQQTLIPSNFLFYAPIMHLNQFLIGNLMGFLYFKYEKRNFDALLLLMGLLLPVVILSVDRFASFLSYHNGLLACYYAPFILMMALNNGAISFWLSKRLFVILGEISYGIYILQKPVYSIVMRIGEMLSVNGTLILFIFIFSLLLISLLSYYFIELPTRQFVNMRYQRFRSKTNVVAST